MDSKTFFAQQLELLHQCISYNPETGVLTWKEHPAIPSTQWDRPVTLSNYFGHLKFNKFNRRWRANQVAWFLYYGEWLARVYHVNTDPTDNRITNLTPCGASPILPSQRPVAASGVPGVYCRKDCRKRPWFALHTPRDAAGRLTGARRSVGHFATKEEAVAALQAAKEREKLSNAAAEAIAAHPAPHLDSPGW